MPHRTVATSSEVSRFALLAMAEARAAVGVPDASRPKVRRYRLVREPGLRAATEALGRLHRTA